MNPVYLDLTKAFHVVPEGQEATASLSTLLCYPYCSQIASCAQISTWQLVWGSEKSPR